MNEFSRRFGKVLPWFALVAGIIVSCLSAWPVLKDIEGDADDSYTIASNEASQRIGERLKTLALVLHAAASTLFSGSDASRAQWSAYAKELHLQLNMPGILAVDFVETADSANLGTITDDMNAWPILLATMERARDRGELALSGKVMLHDIGGAKQPGMVLYLPVFNSAMAAATTTERRNALLGWAYMPLRINDLIKDILDDWQQEWGDRIRLYIYDGDTATIDTLIFASTSQPRDGGPEQEMAAHQHRVVTFGGHQWMLMLDHTPALAGIDYSTAWTTLIVGFVITNLLFGLMLSLVYMRSWALRIAADLTGSLQARQQQLEASEFRWKFALEGAGDGVWDFDVAKGSVFYSRRCLEILGYHEGEIGDSLDEWTSRIHPQDLANTLALMQDCLSGRSVNLNSEHRLLGKNGSYKWVLDRGAVVSRDKDGKPLRMLGTLKDISERKRNEELLEQSHHELLNAQRIAQLGNWTLEVATDEVRWSAELFKMFGLDPAGGTPLFKLQAQLFTAESWQRLSRIIGRTILDGQPYELELEVIKVDGSHGYMLARGEGERDASGRIVRLRGTAADITARVVAHKRIELLSRLYAALSACNVAIVHCRTQTELLGKVCEVVVEHGNMKMAWIGLLDEQTGRISPVHSAGEGVDYLQGIEVSVKADDPHGNGPCGTATRENRAVWIQEFQTDPSTSAWQARAAKYGWVSTAALPLARGGKCIGVLAFYSTERGWFTDEIRALLEEMARDISYALDKFEAETGMRSYQASLQEAEQRFRSLVEQSFVGAFIVQDHRFVYVNPQMENILGYPHDGSLLQLLPSNLLPEGEFAELKQLREEFDAGQIRNIEQMFTARRKDGTSVEVGTTISHATYQQKPAIIGLLQDISNRAVAEAQIKRYAINLERVFMQTVSMATNLVELRDPYTAGHEKHVAEIAVAIGAVLQLSAHQLEGLRIGGYLHDVGKVTVPAEILAKPGRITPPEYELIKGHAQAGYDILWDVEFPWPVAQIALQHHERMDGSGYPSQLKGDEILFEARIIAVADVVESMSSHRPYRPSLGIERALAEIEQGRGNKYDARVVDACLLLFREKGFALPQQ